MPYGSDWPGGDWKHAWAGFGPFGRGRFFAPGEMRLAILSLLAEGPKHGYELIKAFEARSGGLYRASAGTIYPTLQQLEDEELVVSESQTGKRVYHLTDRGRAELEASADAVKNIWNRAARWEDWGQWMGPEAMHLTSPFAAMMKAGLRAVTRSKGEPAKIERIRQILDRARAELDALDPESGARS